MPTAQVDRLLCWCSPGCLINHMDACLNPGTVPCNMQLDGITGASVHWRLKVLCSATGNLVVNCCCLQGVTPSALQNLSLHYEQHTHVSCTIWCMPWSILFCHCVLGHVKQRAVLIGLCVVQLGATAACLCRLFHLACNRPWQGTWARVLLREALLGVAT